MHLLPVFYGHAVTDIGSAVSSVGVFFFRDAQLCEGIRALFVFRPGVEVAYPLPVVVDFSKISPLLFCVCKGVESV